MRVAVAFAVEVAAGRAPGPTEPPMFRPDHVVLLSAGPDDAVVRALRARRSELPAPLIEIDGGHLASDVDIETGTDSRPSGAWRCAGIRLDPARCAVVNRLPMSDGPWPGSLAARLRRELGRFGYVSARPTFGSLMGGFGSLADLWADLPRLVPEARVPVHATASQPRLLGHDVQSVDRWSLYQLGRPRAEADALGEPPAARRIDYRRPPGRLAVLAQVGTTMMFADPPPETTRAQTDAMVAFARALASRGTDRILEHVFFLGDDAPVLYSSCPVPVLSGAHPTYPQLVVQGLADDIQRRGGRAPV